MHELPGYSLPETFFELLRSGDFVRICRYLVGRNNHDVVASYEQGKRTTGRQSAQL